MKIKAFIYSDIHDINDINDFSDICLTSLILMLFLILQVKVPIHLIINKLVFMNIHYRSKHNIFMNDVKLAKLILGDGTIAYRLPNDADQKYVSLINYYESLIISKLHYFNFIV